MTTSETGHPTPDALADLTEGLLPDAEADAVRAHLVDCADCGRVLASLTAVGEALRAEPDPPLPAAVADRWRTAVRAEAADRASSAYASSGSGPTLTSVPPIDDSDGDGEQDSPVEVVTFATRRAIRQSTRRGRALLSVAAAVVLIGVVGGILIGLTQRHQQQEAYVGPAGSYRTADQVVTDATRTALNAAGSGPALNGSVTQQTCALRAVQATPHTGRVVMVLPQAADDTILVGLLPAAGTTATVGPPPTARPYTIAVITVRGCPGGGPVTTLPPVQVSIG